MIMKNNPEKIGIIAAFLILILSIIVLAVPQSYDIAGIVYSEDTRTTQIPNVISVSLNSTVTNDYKITYTPGQSFPPLSGSYSDVLNSSVGDEIIVYAWNQTHYGRENKTSTGDMYSFDLVLNKTRYSEPNVTIIIPENDTQIEGSIYFNITINVTMLGNNASFCNATLIISDQLIANVSTGEALTKSIGNISRSSTNSTYWNMTAKATGSINVTAVVACFNDTINLEHLDRDTTYNITITDVSGPTVIAYSPANNSINKSTHNITFFYNVTDVSPVRNCSLVINNKINKTNSTVITTNSIQNLSTYLINAEYNWSINCSDWYGNVGTSGVYNLTVAVYPPSITDLTLEDEYLPLEEIHLLAGQKTKVYCNATFTDNNGADDIKNASAVIYQNTESGASSPDDVNNHYTNNSCIFTSTAGNSKKVSCSFMVWYFAVNGTWECNMTAHDIHHLINTSKDTSEVKELVALNVTPIIDYGELLTGENSTTDTSVFINNIGNIAIDLNIWGYASDDENGDNLSMMCDSGNISIGYQKYNLTSSGHEWNLSGSAMQNVSGVPVGTTHTDFNLGKATTVSGSFTETYWKIGIPHGIRGHCNGTVQFAGVIS